MLLAVCQELEIEIDEKTIPKLAFGFAGGIGNTGSVCGAVAGAVMAIGLIRERGESMDEAMRSLAVPQELRDRFEAEMGDVDCRKLTGADLTTEEGIAQFMNSDTPQQVCFPAVSLAYRLAVDLLRMDT